MAFACLNGYSRDVSRGGRHGRQAARGDRSESLGAVHVRVWAKDEDCDEKRSATRTCNGSAFSIYSWPQSPRREGSKQIQTSSPYSSYLPRASRRDGSRMPSIPKRFSQSKGHHWYVNKNGKRASYAVAWIDGAQVQMHKHLCPNWAQVNHQNGNGLDNRRENLRGVRRA